MFAISVVAELLVL